MANTKSKPNLHKAQYRIPMELADWLKARADANMRTINGELAVVLRDVRQQEAKEATHAQT
jgi:hypothetical protein